LTKCDNGEILVLPGEYKINNERYQLCKEYNLRDVYYEGIKQTYPHPLEEQEEYFGYRNVYYILLYRGSLSIDLLLKKWQYHADSFTEVALDFYGIKYDKDYQTKYNKDLKDLLLKKLK